MRKEDKSRSLEEVQAEIEKIQAELKDVHGTETEVYARIVGYYRAVKNWNKGKKDEFELRKTFDIENYSDSEAKADSYISEKSAETALESAAGISAENNAMEVSSEESYSYELFAKKTCPNCPPVKDFMKNIPLEGTYVDVDTDEGLSKAASKGVFASPTVILYDSDKNEIARGHNVEELELIFDKILVKAEAY